MYEHVFVNNCWDRTTAEGKTVESGPWALVHIAAFDPVGWADVDVDAGIRSLDRLRAERRRRHCWWLPGQMIGMRRPRCRV